MLYPISRPSPDSQDLIGFIGTTGNVVVQPRYEHGSYCFEGKNAVVDANGKSGFIDNAGNVTIPFHFYGLGYFIGGLCSMNGGFIDHSGNWFIEPRFLVNSAFSEGKAFASLDGETFGFIGLTGDFLIRPEFEQCRPFCNGFAAVKREERWGYIDPAGQIRIPFVFEGTRAQAFQNGIAGVQLDGRWGFVDESGNFVIKPSYEDARPFSEGCAQVRRDSKWGLIASDGTMIVDCRFQELGPLDGGMAPAKAEGKAGFISREGAWVIEPIYDRCYRFFGSLAVVRKDRTYSYISRSGTVVWTSEPGAMVQAPPAWL